MKSVARIVLVVLVALASPRAGALPDGLAATPEMSIGDIREVQLILLAEAEAAFGERDQSKVIGDPRFFRNGPRIMNTFENGVHVGAYSEYSEPAAKSWRHMVYQLSHESVHLLDPVNGNSNWLEEGLATAFAMRSLERHGFALFNQQGPYGEAMRLVESLGVDIYVLGTTARRLAGKLSDVKSHHLKVIVPRAPDSVLRKLTSEFDSRR